MNSVLAQVDGGSCSSHRDVPRAILLAATGNITQSMIDAVNMLLMQGQWAEC